MNCLARSIESWSTPAMEAGSSAVHGRRCPARYAVLSSKGWRILRRRGDVSAPRARSQSVRLAFGPAMSLARLRCNQAGAVSAEDWTNDKRAWRKCGRRG